MGASRESPGLRQDAILALLVGGFAFTLRYLDHRDFANEQFITLAAAQAWLAGDWPIRDYTEPGLILTVGLSAAVQKLFGPTLLSELVLCIGALAVAAAVTCWATTRLTGRRSLGVFAALLQIWIAPVLFAYPKLLIYPVLLAFGLAYAAVQTRPRLVLLAGWAAVAFLIRQDHGIYAFAAGLVLVSSVHRAEGLTPALRRAGVFAAAFLLFLAPFLVYVQAQMGLPAYFALGIDMARLEAQRSVGSLPSFAVDAGPLFVSRPLAVADFPYVRIRWSPDVTDETRGALERRGRLLAGESLEGRTWGYRVEPGSVGALRDVFDEPAVEDVHGIDRTTLALPGVPLVQRVLRLTRLDGLALGPLIPSILSRDNAVAFLFYLCYLLPGLALLLWWLAPWPDGAEPHAVRALLPALCVLAAVCTAGLLRINVQRLPDVFGTFPILLGWVVAALQGPSRFGHRFAFRAIATVLVAVVALSVYRIGDDDYPQLVQETALHPLSAFASAVETARSARDWPWASQWPGDEEWRLAVYVHDCTRPDDRLLVTWQAPEFFYFSKRLFAGREGALLRLTRQPEAYEQDVLDVWKEQSVPIVLSSDDSDPEFAATFPALAQRLATAYTVAGTTRWEGRPSITVHVDNNRAPARTDPEFGLPCFTERRS